ncbi:hypothetical protein CAEBREN_04956 [Caenorhabditis brenneri]|uniref:Uncharacterized protein n=1 Tax=Caenorhabditis brenneri TaxID=135651 RepID=G0NW35_CAEBE|nr:hypothetical protein CAEBREN_04956 [Caenorhabditis brenneri]
MEAPQENILFAARRYLNAENLPTLILVNVKTGQRFPIAEEVLKNDQDCKLGEYISYVNSKLTKKNYLPSTVEGDVAYVDNIQSKLVKVEGTLLFQNDFFADSLCVQPLPPGDYVIRVSLRLQEHKLPSGVSIHFDASNVRTKQENFQTRSLFSPISPPRSPIPNPPVTPGSSTLPQKGPIVKGTGFPAHPKSVPKPNNNKEKVFGAGFSAKEAPKQEKKVKVGDGFAPPEKKKDQVIVGAGFEQVTQKKQKLRAVVLSITENPKTNQNTHFLWILEKQAEGRFVSKERKLLPGHFFSGTYVENKPGKWNCEQYENQIEKPAGIDGGMDADNKIWFVVTINNFQPAGANRKMGSAKAKFFGEVLEGELPSTKLSAERNMKKVKIQRKGIAQGDYVWMVVELL